MGESTWYAIDRATRLGRVLAVAAALTLAGTLLVPTATGERAASQLRAFQAGLLDVGRDHGCVITAAGGARCWGDGNAGALGNGSETDSPNPVPVSNLSGARALAAGDNFGCAVHGSGGVACWGSGFDGELGNGTRGESLVPTPATGITTAVAVTAGRDHVCAVLTDGTARCWGQADFGQLGNGTKNLSGGSIIVFAEPVAVTGLTDARAITAGDVHTCALLGDGTVRCWGNNVDGQLGDGNSPNASATPVAVSGLTGVAALGAGARHTCAVLASGGVRCWGENFQGQLGDGNAPNKAASPVPVSGIADAIGVAAGADHSCALRAGGTVSCWGDNFDGELGNGDAPNDSATAVPVTGISDAVALSAGGDTTCALLSSGSGRCWGEGGQGQLGNGGTTNSSTPVVVPLGSIGQVADLAVGLSADPTDPPVGATTTLTATVLNDGPDPATSVSLAVPRPPGTQRLSHTASQGAYNAAAGFWAVGRLEPGQGATLQLELRKTQEGTANAFAEVASSPVFDPDSIPGNADPAEDDFAQVDIGTGQALVVAPQVRLFVTPRRDAAPRYRFALTALVDLPDGVQPAACTGTVTFGWFFAPLTRLRAIRTRDVIQAGNLCGFRFNVVIPIGLTRAIFNSQRILVLRSLSRFDGNAQLQQTLSNSVFYGAG